jgi:hypothetical protein
MLHQRKEGFPGLPALLSSSGVIPPGGGDASQQTYQKIFLDAFIFLLASFIKVCILVLSLTQGGFND